MNQLLIIRIEVRLFIVPQLNHNHAGFLVRADPGDWPVTRGIVSSQENCVRGCDNQPSIRLIRDVEGPNSRKNGMFCGRLDLETHIMFVIWPRSIAVWILRYTGDFFRLPVPIQVIEDGVM